jgi:hypothetical protein
LLRARVNVACHIHLLYSTLWVHAKVVWHRPLLSKLG